MTHFRDSHQCLELASVEDGLYSFAHAPNATDLARKKLWDYLYSYETLRVEDNVVQTFNNDDSRNVDYDDWD